MIFLPYDKQMHALNSIKKGPPTLLIRYPLRVVQQVDSIKPPTQRQHQLVQRFFNKCDVQLSRVVSDPEAIDGLGSMPEVAFMGRSNVGKSSLLNALLFPKDRTHKEDRDYARVSNTPGHTKTLNFFTCGRQVRIVDMPGYGYGSKQSQGELIRSYLENQRSLKRVYILANCQQGLGEVDEMALDILEELGVPWQLVFTKLDKLVTKPERIPQSDTPAMESQQAKFLSKLVKSRPKLKKSSSTEQLSKSDTDTINSTIHNGLALVASHPTAFEQVIGTSSTKRLSYIGTAELRTSIFQACGLLRKA